MSKSELPKTTTREILRLIFNLAQHGAQSTVGLAEKTYRKHQHEVSGLDESDFRRAAYYAKARGYITEHHGTIILSPRGQNRLEKLLLQAIVIPKKWDNQWRLISFDIPESKRQARDAIRRLVKQLGFVKLHASIWVYPHDCAAQIRSIQTAYGVGNDIRLIIATEIEGQSDLEEHFRARNIL